MRKIIILSLLTASYFYAMETPEERAAFEAIKPCSQEECAKLQEMFNKKDCGQKCRQKHLKQLAKNFDIKKDGQFLRALICADKNNDSYMVNKCVRQKIGPRYRMDVAIHPGFGGPVTTYKVSHIGFLDHAIAQNNIWFVKAFFKLFSQNEPVADFKWHNKLHFSPMKAVQASAEMTQLLYEKTATDYDDGSVEKVCESKDKNKYPGCPYYLRRLHVLRQRTAAEEKKQAQEMKDKNEKWEQELRDISKT